MLPNLALLIGFFLLMSVCVALPSSVDARSPMSRTPALPSYLVAIDLPVEVLLLQREGRLTEAEAWIDQRIAELNAGPEHPLVIERQRLTRVRRDFNLTPDLLLSAVQSSIPDATSADIDRWRDDGHLQWVRLDGELFYFRKEPRNLFRFSNDAIDRRAKAQASPAATSGDPNTVATARFDLHSELESILLEGMETGSTTPGALRIVAKHRVIIQADAVPAGETIRCWIPFPQEYDRQRDALLIASSHEGVTLSENGIGQRTAYLEAPAAPGGTETEFWVEYSYRTSALIPQLDPSLVSPLPADHPMVIAHASNRPPHVDLTDEVRALASEIVGEERNPLLAAKLIFEWMDANIGYCSEMEYSIATSLTEKAMVERAGDCGVQVLLFMSMCRSVGIPARWQSGWAMRPGSENLHDWAEYYVEPYGWLPADPSFGLRRHDDPRIRNFYTAAIDPFRMIANLDFATGFNPPKTHWRSDNIDNQRGEVEWSGGNLYYDKWTYRMEAKYSRP